MQSEYQLFSTTETKCFPGYKPRTLPYTDALCVKATECSQHKGKLGAIAQRAHGKATYQHNSSLPPRDSILVCLGHAFQRNYNGGVCNLRGIFGA